jgi:hypothetical protein
MRKIKIAYDSAAIFINCNFYDLRATASLIYINEALMRPHGRFTSRIVAVSRGTVVFSDAGSVSPWSVPECDDGLN